MSAAHLLDGVVIGSIVLLCAVYVVYALSPVRVQRLLLAKLVKVVGLRVFGWLNPKPGGCDQCAGNSSTLTRLQIDKARRLMKDSKP